MAKDPAAIIPFSEGSPADSLKVEELPDGNVLVGDPETEEQPQDSKFEENIALDLSEAVLNNTASELINFYETDRAGRQEWEQRYKDGLKTLDIDGNVVDDDENRAVRGLSQVVHPIIAEAATQFQARAIQELYPAGGPVRTIIIGEADDELKEQASRVKEYMNYQIVEEMPEFFPDLDKMLFHLPLVGQTFKKVWYDPSMDRLTARFVQAEDFVVSPDSTDLRTSPRYTQIIKLSRNDYNRFVKAGYYEPLGPNEGGADIEESSTVESIEGISAFGAEQDDKTVVLLEMHTYYMFDGIDDADSSDIDAVALPYVITMEQESQTVVSIRRNWHEDDENQEKREWFVEYKFLPGLGFYGFGLYHIIGGLGKVATGSLRALLDSAAFANMQGGFKLKGRVPGGEMDIAPGEFIDLDAVVDDVKKAIMPLPFKEPSGTLFQLLGFVVDAAQRFAAIADLNVGEANNNAPVGTTIALIEQGSRIFSAIHKRLHNSQAKEFRLMMELDSLHLPDEMKFASSGAASVIYRADFDDRLDVIPVSDPNVFSSTQRIAQAQAVLQMAQSAPELHDMYEAYKRMYEALRIQGIEEVLKEPNEAARIDPVDENVSVLIGKPIRAFPDQNHEAHIAVHLQFMNDPSLAGNPAAQQLVPVLISHIAEHVALLYRLRMQKAMGIELPPAPDLRDPNFKFEDLAPDVDNQIAERAAEVVQQVSQMKPIPGLSDQGQQGGNPLEYAKQLAELEAQALQMRTQAEIASDQAKAESDMAIDQAKAQQQLQAQMVKMQADVEAKIAKLQADVEIAKQKAETETQRDAIKAEAEIQRDNAKAEADIVRGDLNDGI
tara:strand:- start:2436 stop:4940 length:2505 start_codon:yes stop_codon:yes gene_type:complete